MGLITPVLPTSGDDRGTEEVDAINALQALVNLVNGNVDGANLHASAVAPYRTLARGEGSMTSADGTGSRLFGADGTSFADGASAPKPPRLFVVPLSNPWLLNGKTAKIRLSAAVACNNVAPGAGTVTFSLKNVALGGTGGAIIYSSGVALTTRTVVPAQASVVSQVGADVDMPAWGAYIVSAAISSAVAANAVLSLSWAVELHYV